MAFDANDTFEILPVAGAHNNRLSGQHFSALRPDVQTAKTVFVYLAHDQTQLSIWVNSMAWSVTGDLYAKIAELVCKGVMPSTLNSSLI